MGVWGRWREGEASVRILGSILIALPGDICRGSMLLPACAHTTLLFALYDCHKILFTQLHTNLFNILLASRLIYLSLLEIKVIAILSLPHPSV